MALLSDAEIQDRLTGLSDWAREGDEIVREYKFPGFVEAIAFVRRVADCAEAAGHHPDITIHYNKVTLALSTHSEGGITGKDLDAAASFDEAVE
jgi:4a-hydroxytetrahydrobiopterin dehydratase